MCLCVYVFVFVCDIRPPRCLSPPSQSFGVWVRRVCEAGGGVDLESTVTVMLTVGCLRLQVECVTFVVLILVPSDGELDVSG